MQNEGVVNTFLHTSFKMITAIIQDNAQAYFSHMASVLLKNYPSVLVHILGVFQIAWSKSNKQQFKNRYVVAMPNLW